MEDFYDLLGVSADASTDEIDRAWRERVRRYHPDVNDDTRANAQFKTLKTAHEVLSDETERAAYDRMGHEAYVRERLGGLPTTEHPYTDDATDDEASAQATADGRAAAEGHATGGDQTAGSNRASGRDRPSGASRTSGDSRTASAGQTSDHGHGDDRWSESREDARNRNRTSSTTAGGTRSGASDSGREGTTADAEATSQTRKSSTATSRRRGIRTPLVYGWIGVAVAAVVYLVGLREYLVANAGPLSGLRSGLAADPVVALTATRSLTAPGTFVLDAAAANATPQLMFGVGAAALTAAFVGVVLSFGRGAAYLYLLGGITPLAGLGVGPYVTAPDGVILALVVVFPLVATLGFLVEVGWVLLASR